LSGIALLYISLSVYIYANQAFYAFLTSPLFLSFRVGWGTHSETFELPCCGTKRRGHGEGEYVMITHDGNKFAWPSVHQHLKERVTMIARDIMTRKVCTIHPEASAQEAAQLLDQMRISGLPVVDEDGKIIGIITEADIISKVDREGLGVAEIMSNEVIFVSEETSVSEIAMLLTDRKIKRVPVVNDGKLVGIVSRADIVHAVAQGHLIIRPW